MKDRFFLGVTGGVLGAATMNILNFLINLIPGIHMELIFGVSKLFVPKTLVGTLQGSLIGVIAHLVAGAMVGLIFLAVLEAFGYDYLLLKGIILGLAAWFVLTGIIGRLLGLAMQDRFMDNIIFILIHVTFGVTTVLALNKLRQKNY